MIPKRTFFLLFLSFFFMSASTQNIRTNLGKEFFVGFMENSLTPQSIQIHISSVESTVVQMQVPVLGTFSFAMAGMKDTIINLNPAWVYVTGSENIQNKGVYIFSSNPIGVLLLNNAPNSSEVISSIPLENIPKGGQYIINTYRGSNSFPSEILLLSVEDSTLVEIIPSALTRAGKPANVPFTILLNKGQVYPIQASDTFSLAGTFIRTKGKCSKLVLYSGSRCSQVTYNAGCSGCDMLGIQEVPVAFWGQKFTTVPINNMQRGYVLSLVASENLTEVKVDGMVVAVLNSKESLVLNFGDNQIRCIEANKKISVNQLLKSGECNGNTNAISDPSMFRLIPTRQYVTKTFFRTPQTVNVSNTFISVLTSNPGDLFLNNMPILQYVGVQQEATCDAKVMINLQVQNGNYELESTTPFCSYLYGLGFAESYATEIGSAYESDLLNFNYIPNKEVNCNPAEIFTFSGIAPNYNNLKWVFGNSDTSNIFPSVSHQFNESGEFKILLIGQNPSSDCLIDTIEKTIVIFSPPELELGNDTVLCLGTEWVVFPNADENLDFEWHNGSKGKNFITSATSTIALTVTDANGCFSSDTLQLEFNDCTEKYVALYNVFTPGRDGLNDFFKPDIKGYAEVTCEIYNRWGILLYAFNPVSDLPWNGGVQNDANNPCPDGTYYYLTRFKDPATNRIEQVSGTVKLIREKN